MKHYDKCRLLNGVRLQCAIEFHPLAPRRNDAETPWLLQVRQIDCPDWPERFYSFEMRMRINWWHKRSKKKQFALRCFRSCSVHCPWFLQKVRIHAKLTKCILGEGGCGVSCLLASQQHSSKKKHRISISAIVFTSALFDRKSLQGVLYFGTILRNCGFMMLERTHAKPHPC